MRDLPILFSAPMVRAILEGRKTQTRRLMRSQGFDLPTDGYKAGDTLRDWQTNKPFMCPYGGPGNHLWVREAWRVPASLDLLSGSQIAEQCTAAGYRDIWCPIQYEADGARNDGRLWTEWGWTSDNSVGRYRHARFMPRWAARTVLEITDVRIERLQSISTLDAIAEGVMTLPEQWINDHFTDHRMRVSAALAGERSIPNPPSPRRLFEALWEQLNGIGSWKEDPWVWVIEFKRLEVA